jgi:2-dehydro-3-deoxyglucarate aldolase
MNAAIELAQNLKSKLAGTGPCVGSWIMSRDPITVEVMARAGFDWLCVDMEHAPIGVSEAAELIRAGTLAGVPMLVRLPDHSLRTARQVADAGACGFIFPDVRNALQASKLLEGMRYPLEGSGTRGVGLGRAPGYGRDFTVYYAEWNRAFVFVPQIEHIDAVENIEEIAGIPGVDALFVGPYDLSASMGLTGQLTSPRLNSALQRITAAAQAAGKAAGFHAVPADLDAAAARLNEGVRFLAYSSDVFILRDICDQFIARVKTDLQCEK